MNRLNWPHAGQQEVCSSIWGQQLKRRGHQTESSSVLQEDRIYPSIEVVDLTQTNASPYNNLIFLISSCVFVCVYVSVCVPSNFPCVCLRVLCVCLCASVCIRLRVCV